jgi:fluoride ion exporter CrcB/FEX
MSLSVDLTRLTDEQRWLTAIMDVLTALFLCTLLYDPRVKARVSARIQAPPVGSTASPVSVWFTIILSALNRPLCSLTVLSQVLTLLTIGNVTSTLIIGIITESLQRASITSGTRQLAKLLLFGASR